MLGEVGVAEAQRLELEGGGKRTLGAQGIQVRSEVTDVAVLVDQAIDVPLPGEIGRSRCRASGSPRRLHPADTQVEALEELAPLGVDGLRIGLPALIEGVEVLGVPCVDGLLSPI